MNTFRFFGWVTLFLAVMLISGCSSKSGKEKAGGKGRQVPKVDAYVVTPSRVVNELTVSGSLLPFEEVVLKNEVAGRVVKLNLPEGKFVKSGTLLVKIFDDDLQANLRKLQAQLAVQHEIQKRQAELLKVNGISQTDFDQLSMQINSLTAEIDVVKAQIRKTEILAPFDGIIGLRTISEGAVLQSSTAVATLRQSNKIKLDFSIPEKYSSLVTPGLELEFSLQNTQNEKYKASVLATEQGIEAATRSLKVRAVVEKSSPDLLPGAYANVKLLLGENLQAIMVPSNAIIPQERVKNVIVSRQGKAQFIEVETGIRKTSSIEILSGIEAGDTVITSGVLFLKPGMPVSYANIKTGEL